MSAEDRQSDVFAGLSECLIIQDRYKIIKAVGEPGSLYYLT